MDWEDRLDEFELELELAAQLEGSDWVTLDRAAAEPLAPRLGEAWPPCATASWALASSGFATRAAAPTAAPFRKPRRSTEVFLDFDIQSSWSAGQATLRRAEHFTLYHLP